MQGVFLKGSPGVGKSFFLDYAMANLLKSRTAVLLLSGPKNEAYLCRGFDEPPETCTFDTALKDKWAKNADYVLYDPHENPLRSQDLSPHMFCGKKFIIAMSPDPANCKKVVKDAEEAETVYMGPTTLEESERMRFCCFNDRVSKDQMRQRFEQGGGIPRFLFKTGGALRRAAIATDAAMASLHERQSFALNDLIENPRRIDAGSVASEFNSLWSIYHLVPDEFYTAYTIELCSDSGRQLLLRRLLEKEVTELWNLFNTTNQNHGTLRGLRFEAYAHKKIMVDGIDGDAKLLTAKEVSAKTKKRILIPAKTSAVYLPDNDVGALSTYATAANNGKYLIPELPNFPVIDSVYVGPCGNVMLQMKAGSSKPLSEKAVAICNALGNVFVFVVPEENTIRKKLAGGTPGMHQYVLILKETSL